jgi:hypothetical protein
MSVLDWRRLRCAHCHGALLVEHMEVTRQRVEPSNPFHEDQPRRGRPPKWLVEKRRQEREILEREAA